MSKQSGESKQSDSNTVATKSDINSAEITPQEEFDLKSLQPKIAAPPPLTHPTGRNLRQRLVWQQQRQLGNRRVQRLLASQQAIQRKNKTEAGGSVEVTAQSAKVGLSVTPSKKVSAGYATIEFGTPVGVSAELKLKNPAPVNAGSEDGNVKTSVEVYKREAKAAGTSKFAQLAYNDIDTGGWTVESAEWENSRGAVEEDGEKKTAVATGVKFSFANGQEHVIKATLFEDGKKSGLSGPNFEMEHTFKLASEKLWENEHAELVVSGTFKLVAKIKPNWTKIMAELANQGGRQVAANFLRSAMTGAVNFLLGAGGLVTGGLLTIATFAAEMNAIQEIKACRTAAEKAVVAYVCGYCNSWAISEFGTPGPDAWFNKGISDGRNKLNSQVTAIQAHPVYAPFKFTQTELRAALQGKLMQHGPAVYNQVQGEVKTEIYTQYVLQFYHKRKAELLTPTYIARKDAIWVARGLGISEDVVPKED